MTVPNAEVVVVSTGLCTQALLLGDCACRLGGCGGVHAVVFSKALWDCLWLLQPCVRCIAILPDVLHVYAL
jgi:hypothetical protein